MNILWLTNWWNNYSSITQWYAYDEDIEMEPLEQTNSPFLYKFWEYWNVLNDWNEISYLVNWVAQFNCDVNYVNYWEEWIDYTASWIFELRNITWNDIWLCIIALTNNIEFPYAKILWQKIYANSLAARNDVSNFLNWLLLNWLPSPEFLPIWVVMIDSNWNLVPLSDWSLYVDARDKKFNV